VFYPGLETHDGHDVAKRQMPGGFGGMVSFVVEGGASAALKVHTYSLTHLLFRKDRPGGLAYLRRFAMLLSAIATEIKDELVLFNLARHTPKLPEREMQHEKKKRAC
jgi:hypothetical protein